MCAWAGYYGWLHAPQKREGGSISWLDIHGESAWHPEAESDYLANHWAKCGRVGSGFNGPIPLEWLQIKAYSDCMRIELQPWECECIRVMSQSYCHWFNKIQQDFDADPPLMPDDQDVIDRLADANFKFIKSSKAL